MFLCVPVYVHETLDDGVKPKKRTKSMTCYKVHKSVKNEVDFTSNVTVFFKPKACENYSISRICDFYLTGSFMVHALNFCCIILLHNIAPDLMGGGCRITKYLL